MGILSKMLLIGLMGISISQIQKNWKEKDQKKTSEENSREDTFCFFEDGISQADFNAAVYRAGKGIKRLIRLSTDGPIIHGTVQSQSGISTWDFTLDFNDYGHITGKYWISSNNETSDIPSVIAKRIQKEIQNFYHTFNSSFSYNHSFDSMENDQDKVQNSSTTGPFCGKTFATSQAKFCPYCGTHL